jgi:cytochrome b pre-mRNA-processing protein 3
MLWPFNRSKTGLDFSRRTIETIYGMIVAQARLPVFYQSFGVPDSVGGRFDMIVLHLWMVLRRLRAAEAGEDMSQALFDRFCSDMDANLREMGVGDLTVPKRMIAFGEDFYGRGKAYDAALEQGGAEAAHDAQESALAAALARNVLNTTDSLAARGLTDYVIATIRHLDAIGAADLRCGSWDFAAPSPEARSMSEDVSR